MLHKYCHKLSRSSQKALPGWVTTALQNSRSLFRTLGLSVFWSSFQTDFIFSTSHGPFDTHGKELL